MAYKRLVTDVMMATHSFYFNSLIKNVVPIKQAAIALM